MDITIATPKAEELMQIGTNGVEIAQAIAIDSPAMYEAAAEELREIVTKKKTLDEQRKSITKPLDTAKSNIMDLFRKPIDLLEQAEQILKKAMGNYSAEQRRIADQQQRRLEAQAAAERERLNKQAAEMAEQAAALEQQAETGTADTTAEVLDQAVVVAAQAEELRTQAAMTVAPVVQVATTKAAGVSTRQNWKYEITDASLIPREYLVVDDKKIGGVVRAMKGDTDIPGIRVYPEDTVAARRAA